MTSNIRQFETKTKELGAKLQELEELVRALRTFAKPGFDFAQFHTHYDPVLEAAQEAHNIYHELLHLGGGHQH